VIGSYRDGKVVKPGSHSSSQCLSDGENVSAVDQLAVKLYQERQSYIDCIEAQKLQAAAEKERKQNRSNFLLAAPPPSFGAHQNPLGSLSSVDSTAHIHLV
jgi:hypothetical protein